MRDLFRVFQRIPEKNRTIAYGILALIKNLFYFLFKIVVGIIFKTPLLIAIAIYNLLIGLVKANCSRGLWKNNDNLKDCKTYINGGVILLVSSLFYILYTSNQILNPYNIKFNIVIALIIATFSTISLTISIIGLFKTKGRTMLIREYRFTNFATALTNLVLTQIALLSLMSVPKMQYYNSILGVVIGVVILGFAIYLVIDGINKSRKIMKEKNENLS